MYFPVIFFNSYELTYDFIARILSNGLDPVVPTIVGKGGAAFIEKAIEYRQTHHYS